MNVRPVAETADEGVEVPGALHAFGDASPALLEARTLQDRVDRKYLLPRRVLDTLLARLCEQYRVLRSDRRLAARYQTVYFDTPERQLYDDHRRGRRPRYKVRLRHHLDRRMSFLEIKRKGPDERTTKARLERPFGTGDLDAEGRAFVERQGPIPAARLAPLVLIDFRRITLVGAHFNERVTMDYHIDLREADRRECWPHVVVAEIKQDRYSNDSPSVRAFREVHAREQAVSKYCLASARLAAVRHNTFRPTLRAVEHLSA